MRTDAAALLLLLAVTAVHGAHVSPAWSQTSVPPSPGIAAGGTNLFSLFLSMRNATDEGRLYPEQVRLTPWGPNRMLVSWSTQKAVVQPLTACTPSAAVLRGLPSPPNLINVSFVQLGTAPGNYTRTISGQATMYNLTQDSNPDTQGTNADLQPGDAEEADFAAGGAQSGGTANSPRSMAAAATFSEFYVQAVFYRSGCIHHVLLRGLTPGTQYFYRVGDGLHWSSEYSFTALGRSKAQWPLRLGVLADTSVSQQTYGVLGIHQALQPHALLHIGDIVYADRYNTPDAWDAYFQMGSAPGGRQVYPYIPTLYNVGNHEIESPACRGRATLGAFPYFVAMNARLPSPKPVRPCSQAQLQSATGCGDIIDTSPATSSPAAAAAANQYFSVDLPGAHLIFLSSYVYGDQFTPDSLQYRWLQQDLAQVNRTETPWLIVVFHEAWYSTFSQHYKENECMRVAYEPLLTRHKVDIYLHGHVHAYERSQPVSNYTLTSEGGVHLIVGNGGTLSSQLDTYMDSLCPDQMPALKQPQFHPWLPRSCMVSQQFLANGTACTSPPGAYPRTCAQCSTTQPAWSAWRESEYGTGMLTILNETTAYWEYFRLTDNLPPEPLAMPNRQNLTATDWVYIHR